jgi:hypothetical protein
LKLEEKSINRNVSVKYQQNKSVLNMNHREFLDK